MSWSRSRWPSSHYRSVAVPKLKQLVAYTRRILQAGICTGDEMERIVGKWTWAILVRRPALSVFNAVYRFIQVAGSKLFTLWPSVERELHIIMRLAPILFASLSSPWLDRIVASDASETGFGVVATPVSEVDVLSTLEDSNRIAQENTWSTIISSRWKYEEHINVLELRAVSTAIRWILSRRLSLQSRVIFFCDSQVVVGAVSKGRSSSHQILRRLRTLSAMVLASGLRLVMKWIPSSANPADEPSRR